MNADNNLTLLLIGDIMLGEDFTRFKQEQGVDYEYPFENCKEVFRGADIVFGNFEGTLSKRGPLREKGPNLYSPPESISALKYLNFSIVSLGNNHINDFGTEGIIETLKILLGNTLYFRKGYKWMNSKVLGKRRLMTGISKQKIPIITLPDELIL
jgi:poly-gamma-glutamate synthesis protein (capsule biosynthesis protein)